jgi:hypothetical protein
MAATKTNKISSGTVTLIVSVVVFAAIVAWFVIKNPGSRSSDDPILAQDGIHWHVDLSIMIKGQRQDIPADIGLDNPGEHPSNLHTHDDTGKIHMELPGIVRASDIKLSKFFEVWEKTFTSSCIFESCSGTDGTLKFRVNGQDNPDFGNYSMRDGDKIEVIFE